MFPSRPPPPHVDHTATMREPWVKPSGGSASLVARIRRQPFAQPPSSSEEVGSPVTSASNGADEPTAVVASSSPSMARQTALLRRLQEEWDQRNVLTDSRRTSVPSCTVAVLCLPADATEEELRRFGERFGRVVATRVVRQPNGTSRKYGFIQYSYAREMQRAVRDCSDPTLPKPRINGKIVVVEMERGRLEPHFVPGRFQTLQERGGCGVTPPAGNGNAMDPTVSSKPAPLGPTTTAEVLDNLDDFLAEFS